MNSCNLYLITCLCNDAVNNTARNSVMNGTDVEGAVVA
jgi:hypothetical protein